MAFECWLSPQNQLQTTDGTAAPAWLTLGEVRVHIDRTQLVGGVCDTAAARSVLRGSARRPQPQAEAH